MKTFIRKSLIRFCVYVLRGRTFFRPSVTLSLSDKCNYKCIFCWLHSKYTKNANHPRYIRFSEQKYKILQWNDFIKIIEGLKRARIKRLYIVGDGESLLNPQAGEMFSYLKEKNIKFSLTTNGSLLNKEISKKLLEANAFSITVSLDSVDESNYKKLHDTKFNLSYVLNNIKEFKKLRDEGNYRTSITLSFVINHLNIDEITEMIKISRPISDYIIFANMVPCEETEFLAITKNDYKKICEKEKEIAPYVYNWNVFIKYAKKLVEAENLRVWRKDDFIKNGCDIPFYFCNIDADGRIFPCCSSAYEIGNAIKEDFSVLWNNDKAKKFRVLAYKSKKELPFTHCFNCSHFV